MSRIIAFAGKGGTGKTTVSALTLRGLLKAGMTPVLAVDADPNSCLGETFGITGVRTIGQMREKFADERKDIPPGMTKEAVFQMLVNQIIVENRGWDLLVMGRPEGPGCYCYVNNVLRKFLESLGEGYRYVLIDHEAGMEHLSRHNTGRADFLFFVAQATVTSLRAVRRLIMLTDELKLDIKKRGLILNMTGAGDEPDDGTISGEIEKTGLELVARIPYDDELRRADVEKIPFTDLEDGIPSALAADGIVQYIRENET
jgi:CO dehydrogenase maturation factor